MLAGALLALLVIKTFRADWKDIGPLAAGAAGANAFAGLFAYLVFRRNNREVHFDRALLILGYLAGAVSGTYLYFT
jgi:hypothetical protein